MFVSRCTCLAVRSAWWNSPESGPRTLPVSLATLKDVLTWPRICRSPTTIESRPLVTRNRWRAQSSSWCWYRCSLSSWPGMPDMALRKFPT